MTHEDVQMLVSALHYLTAVIGALAVLHGIRMLAVLHGVFGPLQVKVVEKVNVTTDEVVEVDLSGNKLDVHCNACEAESTEEWPAIDPHNRMCITCARGTPKDNNMVACSVHSYDRKADCSCQLWKRKEPS